MLATCSLLHSLSTYNASCMVLPNKTDVEAYFLCNCMRTGSLVSRPPAATANMDSSSDESSEPWRASPRKARGPPAVGRGGGPDGRGMAHSPGSTCRMSRRRCRVTRADAAGWHADPGGVW